MRLGTRLAIVLVLAALVAGAIILKERESTGDALASRQQEVERPDERPEEQPVPDSRKELPRLVDLGATECVPCRMMAPILEELEQEYAGRLEVVFIDVWKNPDAGEEHDVRLIPTQIFYDPDGKELFRHEGFFAKEDILGKWQELGFDLTERSPPPIVGEEPLRSETRP